MLGRRCAARDEPDARLKLTIYEVFDSLQLQSQYTICMGQKCDLATKSV
jgi:hypothetical protein